MKAVVAMHKRSSNLSVPADTWSPKKRLVYTNLRRIFLSFRNRIPPRKNTLRTFHFLLSHGQARLIFTWYRGSLYHPGNVFDVARATEIRKSISNVTQFKSKVATEVVVQVKDNNNLRLFLATKLKSRLWVMISPQWMPIIEILQINQDCGSIHRWSHVLNWSGWCCKGTSSPSSHPVTNSV